MRNFKPILLTAFAALGLASAPLASAAPGESVSHGKALPFKSALKHKGNGSPFEKLKKGGVFPLLDAPESTLPMPGKPARITAGGSDIFGWGEFNVNGYPYDGVGLFTVDESEILFQWQDPLYLTIGMTFENIVYMDNKLYGPALQHGPMGIQGEYWNVYDFDNGEVISSEQWNIFGDAPVYLTMVYNPNDDCIYGQGLSFKYDGGASLVFMKAPFQNPKNATVLTAYPTESTGNQLTALCYREDDDTMYGVSIDGWFTRVAKDGKLEKLYELDLKNVRAEWNFKLGMVYSPIEKVFYMAPMGERFSYIATLDPSKENAQPTVLFQNPDQNQILTLFTTDVYPTAADRPEAPVINSVSFTDGSTSGTALFTMPDKLGNGTAISGNFTAVATLDGEEYSTFTVTPGQQLRVEYTDIEQGNHSIGIYAEYNGKRSRSVYNRLYIGFDTPKAPEVVDLTNNRVNWTPVTAGVNNGYIDFANLAYRVFINGEFAGETKETSIECALPEEEPLNVYTATVIAINHDMQSEPAVSNDIVTGQPYALPLNVAPTFNQSKLCTLLDNNGDGHSWSYVERNGEGMFQMGYSNRGVLNDDWVFLMPFRIDDADKYYTLSYEACIRDANYRQERLEVLIGLEDMPGAMTETIVPRYTPMNGGSSEFQTTQVAFKVDEPGVYYIGFHCVSEPYQSGMLLRNISVADNNITAGSPDKVTDIEAVAGKNGELNATINFTMPDKSITGTSLPAGTVLTAEVSSSNETVTVTGTPGERVAAVVKTNQGTNSITILVKNGEQKGLPEQTYVYTGVTIPAVPALTSCTVSEDMQSITIKWSRVTTPAAADGYVNPDDVYYNVYYYSNQMGRWELLQDFVTDTSYTYTCNPGSEMSQFFIGVAAANAAGTSTELAAGEGVIGTPYKLPFEETFLGGVMTHRPWFLYNFSQGEEARWTISFIGSVIDISGMDNVTNEEAALYCYGDRNSSAAIGIPRFDTTGIDGATIKLKVYTGPDAGELTLWYNCSGQSATEAPTKLDFKVEDSDTPEFKTVEFDLPKELIGKYWVALYLNAYLAKADSKVMVSEISIDSNTSSCSLTAHKGSVSAGYGQIFINGYEGQDITISTLDGKVAANGKVGGSRSIYPVAKGIYIVNVADRKEKLIVK